MEHTIIATGGRITSLKRGDCWIGLGMGVTYDKSIIVVITDDDNNSWHPIVMVKTTCPHLLRDSIVSSFAIMRSGDLKFFCDNLNANILSMNTLAIESVTELKELHLCNKIAEQIWKCCEGERK